MEVTNCILLDLVTEDVRSDVYIGVTWGGRHRNNFAT